MLCLSGFEILLSLGAPKPCVLFCIYNWSVWRKVQASELDIVDKTAALDAFEEKVKKKKLKKCKGMVVNIFHHDTLQRVRNSGATA